MATISIAKDQLLFEAGTPVKELYLIVKGSFSMSFPGGEYTLTKGEVIGICELQEVLHRMTCTALEDASVLTYPVSDIDTLRTLFGTNSDYCMLFIRSAIRQTNTLLKIFHSTLSNKVTFFKDTDPALPTDMVDAVSDSFSRALTAVLELNIPKEEPPVVEELVEDIPPAAADTEEAVWDKAPETDLSDKSSILRQTENSLQTILTFSQTEKSVCLHITELINRYKALSDRNASDTPVRALRQEITSLFWDIYSRIFFRLAKEPDTPVPLPVRMFLYFGHMDEQLTGSENMVFLGNTAEFLAQHNNSHIYTLYDWLHAIYTGRKEPSRNEFDLDYKDYVHSLKVSGQIDRQTEISLLDDLAQKVEYELKNMIPSVNKMVSGRISSYCPVFSEHNVQKGLADTFVTAKDLSETLSFITSLDYTVFYREYLYSNPSVGLPKESFHMEILPDILLMPGVGSRGVMWQEIEGKRRTTPSRMMLPIFCQEDLRSTFLHLVGEYRWEMCKRIQGGRWNDVSEPSLTSEYFDYLQFYRKNHDLSAENKERIKNALQKARGSFKEMFVRDYITYILYESTGSPRLSKPSRSILVHHCPFAKQLRTTLGTNPIYKEMMDHLEVVKGQQMHRLELIERKLESNGRELPQALIEERHYYEG